MEQELTLPRQALTAAIDLLTEELGALERRIRHLQHELQDAKAMQAAKLCERYQLDNAHEALCK